MYCPIEEREGGCRQSRKEEVIFRKEEWVLRGIDGGQDSL